MWWDNTHHIFSIIIFLLLVIVILEIEYFSKELKQVNYFSIISKHRETFSFLIPNTYAELSSSSIYNNSTLNLKVLNPKNLKWVESNSQVTFFFPLENLTVNSFRENFTIKVEPVGNTPLKRLASLKVTEYKEDLIENNFNISDSGYIKIPITIVESEEKKIKNYLGYKILFSKQVDGTEVLVLHLLTVSQVSHISSTLIIIIHII